MFSKKKTGRPPKNKKQSNDKDGLPGLLDVFERFSDNGGSEKKNGEDEVDASSVVGDSASTPQQQPQPDVVEQLRLEKTRNAELNLQCERTAKERQSTLDHTQQLEAQGSHLVRNLPFFPSLHISGVDTALPPVKRKG